MCIHLWMTRTVPGWPKCLGGGRSCCCPCPRPSSPKPAPGLAWQSPACFPPLPNAPLPSVACLQHEVSWQTEQFCLEQSLSSYVHLVYPGRSADCAGSPIDCSNWVLLQLYSFHFLYSAWWEVKDWHGLTPALPTRIDKFTIYTFLCQQYIWTTTL